MTTAILAGGNELNASTDYMTRLARDIMVRVQQPKILSCNFAKPNPTGRRESTAIWMSAFKQHFPDSEIIEAKEELFYEQVADADVIYLHGGRTQALFDALPDFARSCEAFRGKVVVGGSAGANYLARLGYSPNHEVFLEGAGFVDVAVLVHYGSADFADGDGWQDILAKVQERAQGDIICLAEGEFVVIEIREER